MHRDSFQDVTVYGQQNFQGYVPNLTPQGERCYSNFVDSKSFQRACASIPTHGTAMGCLIFIDKTESDNGRTYYPCFMVSLHLPPQLRRMRVRTAHATCHRATIVQPHSKLCANTMLTLCFLTGALEATWTHGRAQVCYSCHLSARGI